MHFDVRTVSKSAWAERIGSNPAEELELSTDGVAGSQWREPVAGRRATEDVSSEPFSAALGETLQRSTYCSIDQITSSALLVSDRSLPHLMRQVLSVARFAPSGSNI